MKDLVIYGAGGLGREMILLIENINESQPMWNVVGFYDDYKKGQVIDGIPVIGNIEDLQTSTQPLSVLIAISDGTVRKRAVEILRKNPGINFPTFIHPKAITGSKTNTFEPGCVITAGCILTTGIFLGSFVIINLAATIGHDVRINSYSSIMPGCNISGSVTIGENVLIGTGARILQGLTIGDGSIVGAGAVVTRSVEASSTVIGVPATKRS